MWRIDSFEKTLILGKIKGRKRRGWQRMRWLDGITDSMDMGLGELRELVMEREAWHVAVHRVTRVGHDWATEQNWTYPSSHLVTFLCMSIVRKPWCWERLTAGEEGGNRGWEGWMASRLNGHEFEQHLRDSEDREACCAAVHGVTKSWIRLGDWTAKGKKFLDRLLKQLLSLQQSILNYGHYIVHY